MSRLITTLLLYRQGYVVGRYISIESKIEKTKEKYYAVLEQCGNGWHEAEEDPIHCVKYLLGIILAAYRDFESRINLVDDKLPAVEQVRVAINEKIGTVESGKTVVDMINAVAGTIDFTPYATNARVDEIYKAGEGEEAATGLLADAIVDVAANTAAITALVGSDANKSARSIAAEEINRLIKASDDDGGETIENIGNLVDYVEKNAGEIAALVTQANASTAALAGIDGTVKNYVDTSIEAAAYVLPGATATTLGGIKSAADVEDKVAVNKVYVDAETNIGEVKAFSTDNLVQGKFTLVLNGGDAEVTE
jgi:acylphosphatase